MPECFCFLFPGFVFAGTVNITQPVRYPINISMMLFSDFLICFVFVIFTLFLVLQRSESEIHKGCNSVIV